MNLEDNSHSHRTEFEMPWRYDQRMGNSLETALFVTPSSVRGGHFTSWGCLYPNGSEKVSILSVQILAYVTGMVGLLQPHGFISDTRV